MVTRIKISTLEILILVYLDWWSSVIALFVIPFVGTLGTKFGGLIVTTHTYWNVCCSFYFRNFRNCCAPHLSLCRLILVIISSVHMLDPRLNHRRILAIVFFRACASLTRSQVSRAVSLSAVSLRGKWDRIAGRYFERPKLIRQENRARAHGRKAFCSIRITAIVKAIYTCLSSTLELVKGNHERNAKKDGI